MFALRVFELMHYISTKNVPTFNSRMMHYIALAETLSVHTESPRIPRVILAIILMNSDQVSLHGGTTPTPGAYEWPQVTAKRETEKNSRQH